MVKIERIDNNVWLVSSPSLPEGVTLSTKTDAQACAAIFSEAMRLRLARRRQERIDAAIQRARVWGR